MKVFETSTIVLLTENDNEFVQTTTQELKCKYEKHSYTVDVHEYDDATIIKCTIGFKMQKEDEEKINGQEHDEL